MYKQITLANGTRRHYRRTEDHGWQRITAAAFQSGLDAMDLAKVVATHNTVHFIPFS